VCLVSIFSLSLCLGSILCPFWLSTCRWFTGREGKATGFQDDHNGIRKLVR